MRVTVVGTGYVGLVTGCCLADSGHEVVCVDNNADKVALMQRGESPIFEPGLSEMMTRAINRELLTFTTDLATAVAKAEVIFLALPTPPRADGSADLSAVLAVAKQLGGCLPKQYCVIVDKSTVPVGTAEKVRAIIAKGTKSPFDVVSNPEFLREGRAVADFMEPERVVVGTTSAAAAERMRSLYESFVNDDDRPLIITDPPTAELAKYAANSFLVTKISFMNEIAQLAEALGVDIDALRQIIGSDSRIGHKFLYPGIGFGGSCFPKDIEALTSMAAANGYDFKLLNAAMHVNQQQQSFMADRVIKHFKRKLAGRTIAVWGLAFKPHTDDIRDAPALAVIDRLLKAGARIQAYDPQAGANVRRQYEQQPRVQVGADKYETLHGADALIIATEWPEFIESNPQVIHRLLTQPVVFDGRNIFKPADMAKAGFTYFSVGRRPVL